MVIHVGFTGTSRQPLSPAQVNGLLAQFQYLKRQYTEVWLHHGDAVNGDATAHALARRMRFKVTVHPPTIPRSRAWCVGDVTLPEKPYLARNWDIVTAVVKLYAAPAMPDRPASLRGQGTWTTIGYAEQAHVPVILLKP